MTHADINDLETRDYIFKIGDKGKGIQARYDENTDALIFPRAAFDYVYGLLKEALSQEQKSGKWIKSRDYYGNNHYTCPFCEHDIATKADTWEDNYCSNCGAKLNNSK